LLKRRKTSERRKVKKKKGRKCELKGRLLQKRKGGARVLRGKISIRRKRDGRRGGGDKYRYQVNDVSGGFTNENTNKEMGKFRYQMLRKNPVKK